MATATRTATTSTARRTAGDAATTHDTRPTDRHPAHWLAAVRMLRQGRVFHALADLKTLGQVAVKLGNGFVNVGGHGNRKRGVNAAKGQEESKRTDQSCPLHPPTQTKKTASPGQETPSNESNL